MKPDPELARALDDRMHTGLADSLAHIEERARKSNLGAERLARLVERLRTNERFGPEAFGWYFDLSFAIFDDRADDARHAVERLTALASAPAGWTIARLGDPAIQDRWDLYARRMGPEDAAWFHPPTPETVADFQDRLDAGMALLRHAAPELAEEIGFLLREIILATGDPEASMQFDGGSAYQLWGLLLLNPAFHKTPLAVAEVLAHETGHSLLFGHTTDEPLVFNPDDELYPSPLRLDPRPMDGIFHATYVSARMAWAMRRIADDVSLDSATRAEAEEAARADIRNFISGDAVVVAHGRLSDTGAALIGQARECIRSLS